MHDDSICNPRHNILAHFNNLAQIWIYHNKLGTRVDSVKERSLLGHLVCSEETQKKILESDIFRILKSEGVTEIGALYKVSPSKFVLVFGSKAAKEKLESTEIQCRFGDSDICLNFHKRVGPLRNGREPIFVTILLPQFISDQAVRLAFSNFGDVVSVFKGRHKFNTDIRNGKRHVKIFPAGEDPAILPRIITFHGRIQRDVLFAEKVVLCYRCKTRQMLVENCPVVSPTTKDSSMSLAEQSDIPGESTAPVRLESFEETQTLTDTFSYSGGGWEGGLLCGRWIRFWFRFRFKLGVWRREWIWDGVFGCHGRICLWFRRLRLIRSRTLKSQEQLLRSQGQLHLRWETKLKRKLHHLTLKKQKNRYLKKDNIEILERLSVTWNFS